MPIDFSNETSLRFSDTANPRKLDEPDRGELFARGRKYRGRPSTMTAAQVSNGNRELPPFG